MKSKILIAALCLIFMAACKSEKQKLTDRIASVEKELRNDTTGVMNYKKAAEVIKLYEDFAARFPEDSMSAKYLFNAADVSAHSHNVLHSVELYKKVIEKYPQSKYVPQCWFFIGFLNENELKNIAEAHKAYTTLLEKFPNYEQKETVQWLLKNLGKSDEELVKQFEANQQQGDSVGN
ncbi:MAG: hypothetical protein ABI723_15420 [Bacteroidia bacterium]